MRAETFRDLLNPNNQVLNIGDSHDLGYSSVEGLEQISINSVEEGVESVAKVMVILSCNGRCTIPPRD